MQVAVIISSALGLPLLHELAGQGVVAAVAVPRTPAHPDKLEQVAQTAAALGLPVTRLPTAAPSSCFGSCAMARQLGP